MKNIIVIAIVVAIGWYGNYLYKQHGYNIEFLKNSSTDLANEKQVKCITKTGNVIYGTVPQGTICEKLEPIEGSLTVVSSETRTQKESRYSSSKENSRDSSFKCDGRVYCSQMTSRAEAEFFIKNCPNTKMDGDRDGIPCENDSRF
jgi:hypothetical protein